MLLGHVTEWRKMIENARLKASASSLLPAYPSKQNLNLGLHAIVPHLWKTPANQDTHMVTRSHATQATHTQAPFLLFQLEAQHYPTPISIILFFKKKFNNIELRPLARGFLQSFASCSSWSLLQAAAAACSWAWDTAAVRPLATTAPEAEHSSVWLSPWQL